MYIGRSMMIVEHNHRQYHRRCDHKHNTVEIGSCLRGRICICVCVCIVVVLLLVTNRTATCPFNAGVSIRVNSFGRESTTNGSIIEMCTLHLKCMCLCGCRTKPFDFVCANR